MHYLFGQHVNKKKPSVSPRGSRPGAPPPPPPVSPGTITLADIFCGPDAAIAHKVIAMGVAKERVVFYDKLLGKDLMKSATQQRAYPKDHGNMPRLTIAAPPCTVWAGFTHMNFSEIDLKRRRAEEASSIVGPLVKHLRRLHAAGNYFILEQPKNSKMLSLR